VTAAPLKLQSSNVLISKLDGSSEAVRVRRVSEEAIQLWGHRVLHILKIFDLVQRTGHAPIPRDSYCKNPYESACRAKLTMAILNDLFMF
jgi:hypothetical protein